MVWVCLDFGHLVMFEWTCVIYNVKNQSMNL